MFQIIIIIAFKSLMNNMKERWPAASAVIVKLVGSDSYQNGKASLSTTAYFICIPNSFPAFREGTFFDPRCSQVSTRDADEVRRRCFRDKTQQERRIVKTKRKGELASRDR